MDYSNTIFTITKFADKCMSSRQFADKINIYIQMYNDNFAKGLTTASNDNIIQLYSFLIYNKKTIYNLHASNQLVIAANLIVKCNETIIRSKHKFGWATCMDNNVKLQLMTYMYQLMHVLFPIIQKYYTLKLDHISSSYEFNIYLAKISYRAFVCKSKGLRKLYYPVYDPYITDLLNTFIY